MDFFPRQRRRFSGHLGIELLPAWLAGWIGAGLGSLHLRSSFSPPLKLRPVALLFYLFLHYLEKRRREKDLFPSSLMAFPWRRVFAFVCTYSESAHGPTPDQLLLRLVGRIRLSRFRGLGGQVGPEVPEEKPENANGRR